MRIKLLEKPSYRGTKVLDGYRYDIFIRWNTSSLKWYLDLSCESNGVSIKGIALLCGIDLLAIYGYKDLLGELRMLDNSGKNEDPEYVGIGSRWTLEYTEKAS